MIKRPIEPLDYAGKIAQAIPRGILLTAKAGDEVDTMVIGWGHIGYVWNTPTFIAYVRTSRHTHALLEQSGAFTVNIPDGPLRKDIFKVAGGESGRHVNKIEKLGLTLVEPEEIDVPGILECPITLECEVIYKQHLDEETVPDFAKEWFYPADVTDIDAGGNCYYHDVYFGAIEASYIIEQDE